MTLPIANKLGIRSYEALGQWSLDGSVGPFKFRGRTALSKDTFVFSCDAVLDPPLLLGLRAETAPGPYGLSGKVLVIFQPELPKLEAFADEDSPVVALLGNQEVRSCVSVLRKNNVKLQVTDDAIHAEVQAANIVSEEGLLASMEALQQLHRMLLQPSRSCLPSQLAEHFDEWKTLGEERSLQFCAHPFSLRGTLSAGRIDVSVQRVEERRYALALRGLWMQPRKSLSVTPASLFHRALPHFFRSESRTGHTVFDKLFRVSGNESARHGLFSNTVCEALSQLHTQLVQCSLDEFGITLWDQSTRSLRNTAKHLAVLQLILEQAHPTAHSGPYR